jgi:hypothetical protein
MESWSKIDVTLTPDAASYNMVMNTIVKHRDVTVAAHMAEKYVRHVLDIYQQQQNEYNERKLTTTTTTTSSTTTTARHHQPPIPPDAIFFSTAIGLWAKSGKTQSYRKAHSILDRQLRMSVISTIPVPDVYGWTSVLSSCAAECGRHDEKYKAFQVAASTYRMMQKYNVTANHVTYGMMLKACARLLPPNTKSSSSSSSSALREKWIRITFQDAVRAGCVGDMVVSKLREAATPEMYKSLMQGYTKKTLPSDWTRNVQETSPYRTSSSTSSTPRRSNPPGKRAEV